MSNRTPVSLIVCLLFAAGCANDAPYGGIVQALGVGIGTGSVNVAAYFAERPLAEIESGEVIGCVAVDEVGGCQRLSCSATPPASQSAGTIEVRRSGTTIVSVPFGTPYGGAMADVMFTAGETVEISAGGAVVPAFDAAAVVPEPITSALPMTVAIGTPITVSWPSSVDAERVLFTMTTPVTSPEVTILCDVPASDGTVTVDARLYEDRSVGASGALAISTLNTTPTRSGNYDVDVRVLNVVSAGGFVFE